LRSRPASVFDRPQSTVDAATFDLLFSACEHTFLGSKIASIHADFQHAVERGNLLRAETAAHQLGRLSLPDALEFCDLLARHAPERFERAALRWHARWAGERKPSSFAEVQLALACLQLLTTASHRASALTVLRHLAKR
jgi:hypothetical protein